MKKKILNERVGERVRERVGEWVLVKVLGYPKPHHHKVNLKEPLAKVGYSAQWVGQCIVCDEVMTVEVGYYVVKYQSTTAMEDRERMKQNKEKLQSKTEMLVDKINERSKNE